MLQRADAVILTLEHISHNAVYKIKKECKRNSKKYIMLRSSGVSSFEMGLHEAASAVN